jgi:predicted acylesterase/phospholipase RssA
MNKGVPLILRTYDSPKGRADTCTIHQAARATSAAPKYFTSQRVYGKKWIDGANGHNNPTLLAQTEAERLWPGRKIDTIVSIGSGTRRDISAKNPKQACVGQTTGSHSVHSSMEELNETSGNYFRFDVPELGSEVEISAWKKMDYIEDRTRKYLQTEEVQTLLRRCALTFDAKS